jgi:hypothetical protein
MSDELRPLPGEWYWGIMCPGCHRHCPMYRDITQGTVELTARPAASHLERMGGVCKHCQTPFDVAAEQFHHFQIPDSYYGS